LGSLQATSPYSSQLQHNQYQSTCRRLRVEDCITM
jgi:hypothetical protein